MNFIVSLSLLILAVSTRFVYSETCKCNSFNISSSFLAVTSNGTCSNKKNNTAEVCSFHFKTCTGTCNRRSNFDSASKFYSWVKDQQQRLENFDCANKTETCRLALTSKCTESASKCPVSQTVSARITFLKIT